MQFLAVKRRPEIDGHIKPMYAGEQSCHEAFSHNFFSHDIFIQRFIYGRLFYIEPVKTPWIHHYTMLACEH